MNRTIDISAAATGAATIFLDEMRASDNIVSVQITNAGTTTTLTYECSNDGSTWVACPGIPVGWAAAPTAASTSTAAGIMVFMVQTRYFRVRISTPGTGTVVGSVSVGIGWLR